MNANEKALLEVNWALQEAYKIAVHHSGITDWSTEKPERTNEVEIMQMKIATMILSRLEQSIGSKKIRPKELHCGSCGQKI